MARQTTVLVPAPTANGDLHLGHLGGPFLAADVYARFNRAMGRRILFASGVQESQTYVVSTARRLGVHPDQLVSSSTADVRQSLEAFGISIDGFALGDKEFETRLVDFLTRLHAAGRFELRRMAFPYLERTGEFLMEAHVHGTCPTCLADGCGGVCESCGHHNNPGDLLDPRSAAHPGDEITTREVEVLVLPLERYRERLRAYYAALERVARPHMRHALLEMLDRPLPDFPITFPTSWGIPAPFPEVSAQVVNPSAEAMASGIHNATVAARGAGRALASPDEPWLAGGENDVVYFMGFDNTQTFAVVGVALLMACQGRYVTPTMITNEFYELGYEKFSTSRGHVVGVRELARQVPRDAIRYFLAATSPEHQRTSFSRSALSKVVRSRLGDPWHELSAAVNAWLDRDHPFGEPDLPVTARSRRAAATMVDRFAIDYGLATFSLNRAAETIAAQLARLRQRAAVLDSGRCSPADAGDLCHEIEVFVRCAAPVLIDLADQVLGGTAPHAIGEPALATGVRARRLPVMAFADGEPAPAGRTPVRIG